MLSSTIISILILALPLASIAQQEHWLQNKLEHADTILLVSHKATAGTAVADSSGKQIPFPELVTGKKPNRSIIKEEHVLSVTERNTLAMLMTTRSKIRNLEIAKCFIPRHALFIIKDGNTSYIDICFTCQQFQTSEDLRELNAFDSKQWKRLEHFFRQLGFRYGLD